MILELRDFSEFLKTQPAKAIALERRGGGAEAAAPPSKGLLAADQSARARSHLHSRRAGDAASSVATARRRRGTEKRAEGLFDGGEGAGSSQIKIGPGSNHWSCTLNGGVQIGGTGQEPAAARLDGAHLPGAVMDDMLAAGSPTETWQKNLGEADGQFHAVHSIQSAASHDPLQPAARPPGALSHCPGPSP